MMIVEIIIAGTTATVGGFIGNFLAYRVTVALLKRDVEDLKKSNEDKEIRLRDCEKHVIRAEALKSQ